MGLYEYKTVMRYQDIGEENRLSDRGILNILGEAAGRHAESIGYGLTYKIETGFAWMLLYWKIKVIKRPSWNTEIVVKTWVRTLEKATSWRNFEMYNKEQELIAIGTTKWALIDTNTGRPAKITEEMGDAFGPIEKDVFDENLSGKLQESENMQKIYEYTSERRDIDVNHHVNNVVYLDLAYNAFPEDQDLDFNNFEIYYKNQIKFGEKVKVFYEEKDNIHTVSIKGQDEKTLHAVLKFYNTLQL